jgi:hypothetical protein
MSEQEGWGHVSEPARRDGVKKAFLWFLGFVLVYTAVGIPAYIFFKKRRAEEAEAVRLREVEANKARAERENRTSLEDALRSPAAAPEGIRGPAQGRGFKSNPKDVYDYLPAEQRRMLQPGRGPR